MFFNVFVIIGALLKSRQRAALMLSVRWIEQKIQFPIDILSTQWVDEIFSKRSGNRFSFSQEQMSKMQDTTDDEKKLRHRKTNPIKSDKKAVADVKDESEENKKQQKPWERF